MTMSIRLLFPLLTLVLLHTVGCGTSSSLRGVDASRTNGWTIQLQRISGDGSSVWYELLEDGTLRYAGGLAALQQQPSWSGEMTDEEIADVMQLLERLDWMDEAPVSSDEPADLHRRIILSGPPGRRRFTLRGADAEAAELESILEQAARRRNDPFLERLPKASQAATSEEIPPP